MNKAWRACFLLVGMFGMMSSITHAATLFVESLDDTLGSAATLRQTILDASSGDTIQFNVSGTITLDEALGQLVIDKQLIIDGQNKIVIDGADLINVCFFITGLSASSSEIKNITIQNFNGHNVNLGSGTVLQELPAHGILIDSSAGNCSVINTVIRNINSGVNQNAAGITSLTVVSTIVIDNTIESISSENNAAGNSGVVRGVNANVISDCTGNTISDLTSGTASVGSGNVSGIEIFLLTGNCTGNTISNMTSGTASGTSGNVFGIFIFGGNNCSDNSISNLSSGSADNESGEVIGIVIDQLTGTCLNNTVFDISGINEVGGIRLSSIDDNGEIACNSVCHVTGADNLAFGISIESGNLLAIHDNSIDSVENNTTAHGLLLGGVIENEFVTNLDIVSNVIRNIFGGVDNGFGISIFNRGSTGNDLLYNSISNINGRAINILENGIRVDGTVELFFIQCSGKFATVSGVLNPEAIFFGADFLIQFFVSTLALPAQAKIFIGEQVITAGNGATPFSSMFEPIIKIFDSQFITATATALPGSVQNINTSEVSNALFGCTTALSGLCNIVTICPNEDNLPIPDCPVS